MRRVRSHRRDGWTLDRQVAFIRALFASGSVTRAAAAAGMSRESAYRLRNRREGGLFAAMWDRALAFEPGHAEVHIASCADGRLMRVLGNHFRRECGDFRAIGRCGQSGGAGDRT